MNSMYNNLSNQMKQGFSELRYQLHHQKIAGQSDHQPVSFSSASDLKHVMSTLEQMRQLTVDPGNGGYAAYNQIFGDLVGGAPGLPFDLIHEAYIKGLPVNHIGGFSLLNPQNVDDLYKAGLLVEAAHRSWEGQA